MNNPLVSIIKRQCSIAILALVVGVIVIVACLSGDDIIFYSVPVPAVIQTQPVPPTGISRSGVANIQYRNFLQGGTKAGQFEERH